MPTEKNLATDFEEILVRSDVEPRRAFAAWLVATSTAVLAVLAVALHIWNSANSVDLFIDEASYLNVARSVASGHFPTLFNHPFVLHPALFFIVAGAALNLFHLGGPLMRQVIELRWLDAILSGLLVVVAGALTWRATMARATRGAVISSLFAVSLLATDAYIERFTGRVLLEALTGALILLGWFFVLRVVDSDNSQVDLDNLAVESWLPAALLSGLFFGLALCTKEAALFGTLLPLGIAGIRRLHLLAKRLVVTTTATALGIYGLYVAWVARSHHFGALLSGYHNLLSRAIGVNQISGFNAPHTPPVLSVLASNLQLDGPSYIITALGVLAAVFLVWRRTGALRLLGLATLTSALYFLYAALFGAFEEQSAFYVVVPAIIALALAIGELVRPSAERVYLAAALGLLLVVPSLGFSIHQHQLSDHAHLSFENYFLSHPISGGVIGVTSDVDLYAASEIYPDHVIELRHASDLTNPSLHYIVIETKLTDQGYSFIGSPIYSWLQSNATLVKSFSGYSVGELRVYSVNSYQPPYPTLFLFHPQPHATTHP